MKLVAWTIAALLVGSATLSSAAGETKTVVPKQLDGPVINPGKGWVCYGQPNPARLEEIKLSSLGYKRFEWGALQPEEEKFDWAPIDDFIKAWAKHGKQVAFGVMIANTHSNAKDGYTTPKWVFEAGVKKRVQTIRKGEDAMKGKPGVYQMPENFQDPILLKKLDDFLKALAQRYDGHSSIAFIDKATNRIGFHFVLEKADYPAHIKNGQAAEIKLTWMNMGVSRIFVPCVTKLALVDAKGNVVAVANVEGSDPSTWLPDTSTAETSKATFTGANLRGTYSLAIGLGDSAQTDKPVFRIGIDTPMVDKWHVLGHVQID